MRCAQSATVPGRRACGQSSRACLWHLQCSFCAGVWVELVEDRISQIHVSQGSAHFLHVSDTCTIQSGSLQKITLQLTGIPQGCSSIWCTCFDLEQLRFLLRRDVKLVARRYVSKRMCFSALVLLLLSLGDAHIFYARHNNLSIIDVSELMCLAFLSQSNASVSPMSFAHRCIKAHVFGISITEKYAYKCFAIVLHSEI